MNQFLRIYVPAYLLFSATAIALAFAHRNEISLFHPSYRRFLFQPWKVVTASLAFLGFILIAPKSGDPTWDTCDSIFMSVLTFLTAPWAAGVLFRFTRGKASKSDAVIAIFFWLFSASWSYDLYIWWRNGAYPPTWAPNIVLSSILYFSGGLLWSLDGWSFAFAKASWLDLPPTPFGAVIWPALLFIGICCAISGPFALG